MIAKAARIQKRKDAMKMECYGQLKENAKDGDQRSRRALRKIKRLVLTKTEIKHKLNRWEIPSFMQRDFEEEEELRHPPYWNMSLSSNKYPPGWFGEKYEKHYNGKLEQLMKLKQKFPDDINIAKRMGLEGEDLKSKNTEPRKSLSPNSTDVKNDLLHTFVPQEKKTFQFEQQVPPVASYNLNDSRISSVHEET